MKSNNTLKGLTLEQLWRLFPIILSPHRPQWRDWAAAEIESLSGLLAFGAPVITHIGSTAIPGIWSKPTVDILVELSPASWSRAREAMEAAGYICMSGSASRMSFNKGYTPQGYAERVFHIHFHVPGDNDEILFRDYLNSHHAVAREYEELKRSLAPRYRHDRDGYTEAKRPFVQKVLALAKSGG